MNEGTERKAFEYHFSQPPYEWEFVRYQKDDPWPGNYVGYHIQCAWEGWQARAIEAAHGITAQKEQG